MTGATPDPQDTWAWLERLYDTFDAGWLTLFALDRTDGTRHVEWMPIDDYDYIAERAVLLAQRCDVWHGVATRTDDAAARPNRGRGGVSDCAHLPGLWLDVDIAGPGHKTGHALPGDVDRARQLIADYPLEPTAVVHSGGGLQAWWLFREPLPADQAAGLLARWGATWAGLGRRHGWHVDNVFDIARIMRLPGTLNRKVGEARPVVVIEACTARYDPSDLDEWLSDPPAPPEPADNARVPYIGPARPGDAFNATRTGADVLRAHGWTLAATDRNGDQHWTRPGKEAREGSSATVYADDGHTTVYSDTVTAQHPTLEVRRPYDAFGLLCHLAYGGDWTAASDALEQQGYGTKARARDDLAWLGLGGAGAVQAGDPVGTAVRDAPRLPDDFWGARAELGHIRSAAHARQRSADAVLHVVLARLSAFTPHTTVLPAIVGARAPLAYFAIIIAPPGVGKSSANAIGTDLLPAPEWIPDQVPLGSGEGIAETLFDLVDEEGGDGKRRKVKKQVKHNGFIYTDEGQVLGEIGGRSGSTLLPTIRTIWTGGALGQANASIERRRIVPGGSYVFGMSVALQPSKAGALLEDVDAGTPQRFGWASATDPTVPDTPPEWPGELDWTPPPRITGLQPLKLASEIASEIRAEDLARVRGEATIDPLDAHAGLYKLKVAGLLAVLDGRTDINVDDWSLAQVIKDTSDAVRDSAIDAVRDEVAMRERQTRDRHVRHAVAADEAVRERQLVAEVVEWIVENVDQPVSRSDLRRKLKANRRKTFDEALERAEIDGLIVVETETNRTGNPKMTIRPANTAA